MIREMRLCEVSVGFMSRFQTGGFKGSMAGENVGEELNRDRA